MPEHRDGCVGLIESLHAAHLLHVLGGLFFGDVGDVVGGDDAKEDAARVEDGERNAVVAAHGLDGLVLGLVGPERDEVPVHQRLDRRARVGQEDLPEAKVVDEHAAGVNDVDDVDGLGVAPVLADVLEGVGHRPVGHEPDVVRVHEATDALGRVSEDGLGGLAVLGAEGGDDLLGARGRELVDEPGPVVGVHALHDTDDILVAELENKLFLHLRGEVGEDLAGVVAREEAETDGPVVGLETGDDVGDVGRGDALERVAQLAVRAVSDELGDLGLDEFRGGGHWRSLSQKMLTAKMRRGTEVTKKDVEPSQSRLLRSLRRVFEASR
jgi:hypothetical protein